MLEHIIHSLKKIVLAGSISLGLYACGDTTIVVNNYLEYDGGRSVATDTSRSVDGSSSQDGRGHDSAIYSRDANHMDNTSSDVNQIYPDANTPDTGMRDTLNDVNQTYADTSIPDVGIQDASNDVNPIYPDVNISDAGLDAVINTSGRIVLRSGRDGNSDIYSMNADGSDQQNLTNNVAYNTQPQWSPDGIKIAFISNRDGNLQYYVMERDGSSIVQISDDANGYTIIYESQLSWSPDSTKIAYEYYDNDANCRGISVVNVDGSGNTRLTNIPCGANKPNWSPDGLKIAYELFTGEYRDGNNEVYSMNADGTEPVNLTRNLDSDEAPIFSPDGTKIAFKRGRYEAPNIYVMNADGTGQTNITNSYFYINRRFCWSPDSGSILFERYSGVEENSQIYRVTIDDLVEINLSNNAFYDRMPRFSPDGSRIVFMSTRNGNAEIFTMDSADGANLRNLSNDVRYNDTLPDWGI